MGMLPIHFTLAVMIRICYQHCASSKNFRNTVMYLINMSDTSSLSGPCLSLESCVRFFFVTGIFSLSSSCLHSSVHPPPAAVACEAVHLPATADVAQPGIASSFLETESVSVLWCFIPWSQHRKNVLFFRSQHMLSICMSHMYYRMSSLNMFVTGSELFIVLPYSRWCGV